jgi:hypothetical protein
MHFPASQSVNLAAQQPRAKPIEMHQHALVGFFYFGHDMGFQTQLTVPVLRIPCSETRN